MIYKIIRIIDLHSGEQDSSKSQIILNYHACAFWILYSSVIVKQDLSY